MESNKYNVGPLCFSRTRTILHEKPGNLQVKLHILQSFEVKFYSELQTRSLHWGLYVKAQTLVRESASRVLDFELHSMLFPQTV